VSAIISSKSSITKLTELDVGAEEVTEGHGPAGSEVKGHLLHGKVALDGQDTSVVSELIVPNVTVTVPGDGG
jgi:hypothetical protein